MEFGFSIAHHKTGCSSERTEEGWGGGEADDKDGGTTQFMLPAIGFAFLTANHKSGCSSHSANL